jgi:hypothetical protein
LRHNHLPYGSTVRIKKNGSKNRAGITRIQAISNRFFITLRIDKYRTPVIIILVMAMAGRIRHNLGPKAQGNARRTAPKIGENEFQRLRREGWIPEFLANADDPRIEQIRKLSNQKVILSKAFDPKTGTRIDDCRVLVWTKGMNSYQRLRREGWKPRFLAEPADPWIKQERKLGIQQVCLSDPFNPATGVRINDSRVLVWTK